MPDFSIENSYIGLVAGIDEVGRGCCAGPVVSASVILDRNNIPHGIKDSKALNKKNREELNRLIIRDAIAFGVGVTSVEEIDEINILQASLLAMRRAYYKMDYKAEHVIVDGRDLPNIKDVTLQGLIKGDNISLSIAAASIVAKVYRDQLMHQIGQDFPEYKWEKNAGYPTLEHREAIKKYGIVQHHRKTYATCKEYA